MEFLDSGFLIDSPDWRVSFSDDWLDDICADVSINWVVSIGFDISSVWDVVSVCSSRSDDSFEHDVESGCSDISFGWDVDSIWGYSLNVSMKSWDW